MHLRSECHRIVRGPDHDEALRAEGTRGDVGLFWPKFHPCCVLQVEGSSGILSAMVLQMQTSHGCKQILVQYDPLTTGPLFFSSFFFHKSKIWTCQNVFLSVFCALWVERTISHLVICMLLLQVESFWSYMPLNVAFVVFLSFIPKKVPTISIVTERHFLFKFWYWLLHDMLCMLWCCPSFRCY